VSIAQYLRYQFAIEIHQLILQDELEKIGTKSERFTRSGQPLNLKVVKPNVARRSILNARLASYLQLELQLATPKFTPKPRFLSPKRVVSMLIRSIEFAVPT
jgi:hypothetical protein